MQEFPLDNTAAYALEEGRGISQIGG